MKEKEKERERMRIEGGERANESGREGGIHERRCRVNFSATSYFALIVQGEHVSRRSTRQLQKLKGVGYAVKQIDTFLRVL